MFQYKIINTILAGDTSAFSDISGKEKMIFTQPEAEALYNLIYGYFIKFSKIPSQGYLTDFFIMEKDNPAKKAYDEIDLSDTTDNLKPLIHLQLSHVVRNRIAKLSAEFHNKLKLSNASDTKALSYEFQNEVSHLNSFLEEDAHRKGLLYGEKAHLDYQRYYESLESEEHSYFSSKFGLDQIDNVLGGVKYSDMVSLLGYVGQNKSTLLRYIEYKQVMQGLNTMFVTVEMTFESIQNAFYALHANNYQVFGFNKPKITVAKIREGRLSEEEKDFLFNEVIPDFNNNPNYGSIYLFQPENEFSIDDLFSEVNRVHNTIMPLDSLAIDYLIPLIKPSKKGNSFDSGDYNQMHRRTRRFGLTFDNGRGLTIFNAVQSNRGGYDDAIAKKNKNNLYNITAIGDYNAIERDSTIIMSVLQTDEMRANNVLQIQNLKSRESAQFPVFQASLNASTGVFSNTSQTLSEDDIDSVISSLEI